METINYIKDLIDEYIHALSEIDAETESEYQYKLNATREQFASLFNALRNSYPELLHYNWSESMTDDECERTVNRMFLNASSRYSAAFLPTGNVAVDHIMDDVFVTPTFMPWQCEGNRKQNFVISYDNNLWYEAQSLQATLLQNMLLCFAPGKIRFNIFDFSMTGMSDAITLNYNSDVYNEKVIMEDRDATECIRRLRERMQAVMQKYGDMARYNERKKAIEIPYEVVVLNNYPEGYERYTSQLQPIFENGYKGGIYFVIMHNSGAKVLPEHVPDLLYSENKTVIPFLQHSQEGTLVNHTPILQNEALIDAYRRNFHHLLYGEDTTPAPVIDFSDMMSSSYTQTYSEIAAPIGSKDDGEAVAFKMDVNKGHYHAFIIGETGSGKSRFLHDIIINMISRYSPGDVELYLMDFKGVEFNDYRDIKHSRVVLVDRADERITYEVIYELKEKMEERQRILASAGASDVDEFNKMSKDKHLSQIILIADECQTLFSDRSRNSRLQNEMIDIIALIAQQGRAYGVHLLLATQSLSNAPQLGRDILNQIGEHYILPCLPADARRLVPDHEQQETEKVVSKMVKGKGQCYYQGADGKFLFTFNYIAKGEEQSRLIDSVKNKTTECVSNGQVYFSGSLQYQFTPQMVAELASKGKQQLVASPGQGINLKQAPLSIVLRDDMSENILLMGINDRHYVTRVALNTLISLMAVNKAKGVDCEYIVLDCYENDEANYYELLDTLFAKGLCRLVRKSERISTLHGICEDIAKGYSKKQKVLFILGEENFRELKYNMSLEGNDQEKNATESNSKPESYEDALAAILAMNNPVTVTTSAPTEDISHLKTIADALEYILSKGTERGVHTIMQLDKADNLYLGNDGYMNVKALYSKFKHLILLRSNEKDIPVLRLPDDVRPDRLENNAERLRAYYYNEGNNTFALFTPYMQITSEQINNLIN